MPRKTSAGILLYRWKLERLEILLGHPGGPFWSRRDEGAWTIPKGEYVAPEAPEAAARREFSEELGADAPGELVPLGEVVQRGGKIVACYAGEGDFDVADLQSIDFEMEWPPRSGRMERFPELDRAQWFTLAEARRRILPSQVVFIERLEDALGL